MNTLSLPQFLEATSSDSPVPGGGSVSALCGALGSALGTMVCRLTLGRKKYAEHEERVNEIIARVSPCIDTLAEAIQRDSDAYNLVMQAFKLPKDTDEQKAHRRAAIGSASLAAAVVPMEVAETALSVMKEIEPLAEIGNQNAITDVGVAMMCLRTAVLGAALNVRINLGSTGDEAAEANLRHRCDNAEREAIGICERVYSSIHAKI